MILPVVAYGDPVLKKQAVTIDKDFKGLKDLIDNMYETMYAAYGVGLAAPQVGYSIRLFLVDTAPFSDDESLSDLERESLKKFKKTFINPILKEETGESWTFSEGCLSIPGVREDVSRKSKITIQYQDENFNTHTASYNGLIARVIQHEYDHIDGILFTDKLSSFKKRLLKSKLSNISKGKISPDYKMRFPKPKKNK